MCVFAQAAYVYDK